MALPFTPRTLLAFVRSNGHLLPDDKCEEKDVREVGDGNINYVFLVGDSVCVKQSLPFIRVVKEAALSVTRLRYEYEYLKMMRHIGDPFVVCVSAYDPTHSCMVMECLSSPFTIARRIIVQQRRLPRHFIAHMASHLAISLFRTSDFALPASEKRALIRDYSGNAAMCHLTEEVIFTCPYTPDDDGSTEFPNRHTSPQLDDMVECLRADGCLKVCVARLKHMFLCNAEALLHGDLHTGSIMMTDTETKVMDAEFAFMGPMAFDIGLLLGNLILSYFAAATATATVTSTETPLQVVIREGVQQLWDAFVVAFRRQWDGRGAEAGDAYPRRMCGDSVDTRRMAQDRFFASLWRDTLGYAGCEMIRRVVGIAHVEDLECIVDDDARAYAEFAVVLCARWMVCHPPDDVHTLMATMTSIHSTRHNFFYKASALLVQQSRVLVVVVATTDDNDADGTAVAHRLTAAAAAGLADTTMVVACAVDPRADGWQWMRYDDTDDTAAQLVDILRRVRLRCTTSAAAVTFVITDKAPMHVIHESYELCRNNTAFVCPVADDERAVAVLGVPPNVDDYVFTSSALVSTTAMIHAFQRARVPFILGDRV